MHTTLLLITINHQHIHKEDEEILGKLGTILLHTTLLFITINISTKKTRKFGEKSQRVRGGGLLATWEFAKANYFGESLTAMTILILRNI